VKYTKSETPYPKPPNRSLIVMFKICPITCKPILKEQVWGGNALAGFVKIPKGKKTGEAWFLADQAGNESVIADGPYEGLSVAALMKTHAKSILGEKLAKKYGVRFPLLFKYIDSRDRLSVQVHPNDALARKKGSETGKTEAWYVIDSGWGAYVRLGFKHHLNEEKIKKLAASGKIPGEMKKYSTRRGDSFLIPAGTVHSIGPANLIFEIQQNSDATYRLYDWGRKNLGVQRELQIDAAVEAVRYDVGAGKYNNKKKITRGVKIKRLASCGYFGLVETAMEKDKKYWHDEKAPVVLAVVGGEIEIDRGGQKWRFKKGAVILLPFVFGAFLLRAIKTSKLVITEVK
jgi:mannose-6-phosphate isomerase